MFTLIVLGICAAVALTGKICQSLRDNVTVQNIDYITPSSGFKKLISSTANQKFVLAMSKAQSACNMYANKIKKVMPKALADKTEEMADMLVTLGELEGYEVESAGKSVMTVAYSNETGKFSMFNMLFTPKSNGEKVEIQTFDLTAEIQLPYAFVVQETTQQNSWRTKTTQSLVAKPQELTYQTIVDAISMAIAPCLNGDIPMPDSVKQLYQNIDKSENPSLDEIPSSFK